MKKLLTLAAVAATVALTSCGGNGIIANANLNTEADSLAYSLGLMLGSQSKGIVGDEAIEYGPLMAGIQKVLETPTGEMQSLQPDFAEADNFLRNYINVVLPARHTAESEAFLAEVAAKDGISVTDNGVYYEIKAEGDAKKIIPTDTITAHYKGTLSDGSTFDSSYDRDQPITMPLSGLIPGWIDALPLIGKGGAMTLYIPSEMAYGNSGHQLAGQALVFEIEVLDVKNAK